VSTEFETFRLPVRCVTATLAYFSLFGSAFSDKKWKILCDIANELVQCYSLKLDMFITASRRCGAALTAVYEEELAVQDTTSNDDNAKKCVFVITDKESTDDVETPVQNVGNK